jgi:hypothetical protein
VAAFCSVLNDFLHRGFNLPGKNAFDGRCGHFFADALLAQPAIEG